MRRVVHRSGLSFGLLVLALPAPARAQSAAAPSIYAASLAEANAGTEEISTAELQRLLAGGNVVLLDTRPHLEWAISHIPGALNVAPKPGMPMSLYTSDAAEVGRLVGGDRTRPLVLYCNGPFCGKSRRVAEELLAAGHTNVRRYQLGAPVWRALGGIMVIAPEGVRHVAAHDGTAVWLDARDAAEFQAGSLPGAKHLPESGLRPGKDQGEVKAAKDDGRLPMHDHNTRIIVFGRNAANARAVADALAKEAFHNTTYFDGDFRAMQAALDDR